MRFSMTKTTEADTVDGMLMQIVDRIVEAVEEETTITVDISNCPQGHPAGDSFKARLRAGSEQILIASLRLDACEAAPEQRSTGG